MSRVLVTGGAGNIGTAVVRRLLREGDLEVRVADQREPAPWVRAQCEIVQTDLRDLSNARRAASGCDRIVHLAAIVGGIGNFHKLPYTLTEVNSGLNNAIFHVGIENEVERFVYVSSSMVFERAALFPTPEEYLADCPVPQSAYGFSKLAGEMYCRAAHAQHGLRFTICRPFNAYGPGEIPDAEPGIAHAVPDLIRKVLSGSSPLEIFGSGTQTRTLTYVDDIADGIVRAMRSPAGLNEDFNISAKEELSVAEIARLIWDACGAAPGDFALKSVPSFAVDVQRRWPSVRKAKEWLGWEAPTALRDGLARTVDWIRAQQPELARAS
ncbi:MAG: NAD-dependent epimerase/dehydratase family protein [Chloroflexi bacterium]|nr:MAG: NAD-dependent epimerase/dehydratase family protein [Chloroflexota bacterium]